MEINQKMYLHLFNAVTDALEEMENCNYGLAAQLLKKAQQTCEEICMDGSEDPASSEIK